MNKGELQHDMLVAMARKLAAAMAKWEIPMPSDEERELVQRYVNVMLTYQPCKEDPQMPRRRLPATLPFWGVMKHRNAECERECVLESCPLSHNKFEMRFHPLLYKQCDHRPGELCAVTQGCGRDVVYCGFYHESENPHAVEVARYIALLHISQTSCPFGRSWRAKMPQTYADLVKAKSDFPRPRVNDYVYVMCCYKTVPCDAYLQGACCENEWDCFDFHTMATRRRSPLIVKELAHEEITDRTGHKESKPDNDPTIHITIERCTHVLYKRTPHAARQTCKIVERHHNPIFCPFLHDTDDKTALEDARSRVARMEAAFLKENPDVAQAVEKAKKNPSGYTPLVKIPVNIDVKEVFRAVETLNAPAPAPAPAAAPATTAGQSQPSSPAPQSASPQPKKTEESKPAVATEEAASTTATVATTAQQEKEKEKDNEEEEKKEEQQQEEAKREVFGVTPESASKKGFPNEYFDGVYKERAVLVRRRARTDGCTFTEEEKYVQTLPAVCENIGQALALEQDDGWMYHALPGDLLMPMSRWVTAVREGCRQGTFHAFGETERAFFRGIARALSFLHAHSLRYTALSPSTVLVDRLGRPRLCAFEEARFVHDSATGSAPSVPTPFMAPEVLAAAAAAANAASAATEAKDEEEEEEEEEEESVVTTRADSFSYGLLVWHVLTGRHAYGNKEAQQRRNICDAAYQPKPVDIVQSQPELFWLLQHLLIRHARARYTAEQILQHPALWSAAQRLQFFSEVALFFASHPECRRAFDAGTQYARVVPDWSAGLDAALVAYLPKAFGARPYSTASLADVLRLVCNLSLHYDALPPALRVLFQSHPDGLCTYFARHFPTLLVAVYKYAAENLAELAPFVPFLAGHSPQALPYI